jgi:thioredoxin reductase (NADPH)
MAKPGIVTVDDDVNVLRAVQSDLRKKYGSDFRISSADSGAKALELLTELKKRGDSVALMVVDQRMPNMSGVEFLKEAIELFPESKRVLLTAYADTDAAIDAINQVQIDHYLLKPWDPPEEKLYPLLSDLLDDWQSHYRSPFEGIRVVGSHWSPASHEVKDFLARNNIPYKWLDPETSDEAQQLIELSKSELELPCLFFPDGSTLEKPANREIADKVGLKTTADMPLYDLAIVGAGPAGLAASVYGASEGLRTIVIEQQAPGGQAGMSSRIENYLGFPKGLSGAELARRASSQAIRLGAEILAAQEAVELVADGPARTIKLADGSELKCRAVLLATGVAYRKLNAPGIDDLTGAGVYYGAAMTEGETVRGTNVLVVGGANSAGQAAMYFSRFAKNVTMLVRGESVSATMSQYLIDQIGETPNIEIWTKSEVKEAIGSKRLEKLVLRRDGGEREETVDASAIFIFIGAVPRTDWIKDVVARDNHGFVYSGKDVVDSYAAGAYVDQDRPPYMLETSVPGVFVAGDVRSGGVKRVASAVGEGSMAVMYVHRYLNET